MTDQILDRRELIPMDYSLETEDVPERICTKCLTSYPATAQYFHRTKSSKYGLNAVCKKCRSVLQRKPRKHGRPKKIESPTGYGVGIPLAHGKIAVIDSDDEDLASVVWSLNGNGYAIRQGWPAIHRIILSRKLGRDLLSTEWVDHIDRNKLNNSRSNLRLATCSQNNCNSRKRKGSYSIYKGVVKTSDGYRVTIRINKRTIYIGLYHTEEVAADAYDKAAIEAYGEFALTNAMLRERGEIK